MVCPEWRDFETFWRDMSPEYVPGLQLDRIDNNAGYSKTNCRWVTQKENQRNREDCVVPGWAIDEAAKHGISGEALRGRLRSGWDIQQACTKSVRKSRISKELREEAVRNGISYKCAHARVQNGWDPREACTRPIQKYPVRRRLAKDEVFGDHGPHAESGSQQIDDTGLLWVHSGRRGDVEPGFTAENTGRPAPASGAV